jgi:hypothetical protein
MRKALKVARLGVVVGFYSLVGKFVYSIVKREKYD